MLRRSGALIGFLSVVSCGAGGSDICQPDDADGIVGGSITFDLTVDDTRFSPAILTAQNQTNVTLILHNKGTKPHDFVIDCMPTPNADGCPGKACFPAEAAIPPVDPGASATAKFVTPNPEGIYYYHSDLPGDADKPCAAGARGCGQFQVK